MTATTQKRASTPQTPTVSRKTPMRWFTDICVHYVERLMPDPYLFAVILTLIVVALIFILVPGAGAGGIVDSWYQGVWGTDNIFTFAMQMVLILVSGYTLAEAPIVKRGLGWLASKPRNQVQGALLCFGVAAFASVVNWGLGLVVRALLARQVAARLHKVSFGYMVAAGYMGFMVWTNGLSSSIALANTDPKSKAQPHLLADPPDRPVEAHHLPALQLSDDPCDDHRHRAGHLADGADHGGGDGPGGVR